MVNADLVALLILFGLCLVMIGTFTLRNVRGERVRFDRTDQSGGSALLGKVVMEMGYWTTQPAGRWLARSGATPNSLSWAAAGFGAATGVLLATGHFGFAAIVATVTVVLDLLDGMVARLRDLSSASGEVLDTTVDRYVELCFIAGLALHYDGRPWLVALCLAALAGAFMVSYASALIEAARVELPSGLMRRPERCVYLIVGAGLSAVTAPLIEEPLGLHGAIGVPMLLALAVIAVVANVAACLRLRGLARILGERASAAPVGRDAADRADGDRPQTSGAARSPGPSGSAV